MIDININYNYNNLTTQIERYVSKYPMALMALNRYRIKFSLTLTCSIWSHPMGIANGISQVYSIASFFLLNDNEVIYGVDAVAAVLINETNRRRKCVIYRPIKWPIILHSIMRRTIVSIAVITFNENLGIFIYSFGIKSASLLWTLYIDLCST